MLSVTARMGSEDHNSTSKLSIFTSAFLDGPMGGLFGVTELPFASSQMFRRPKTAEELLLLLAQGLREVLRSSDLHLEALRAIKVAIEAADREVKDKEVELLHHESATSF